MVGARSSRPRFIAVVLQCFQTLYIVAFILYFIFFTEWFSRHSRMCSFFCILCYIVSSREGVVELCTGMVSQGKASNGSHVYCLTFLPPFLVCFIKMGCAQFQFYVPIHLFPESCSERVCTLLSCGHALHLVYCFPCAPSCFHARCRTSQGSMPHPSLAPFSAPFQHFFVFDFEPTGRRSTVYSI